MTLFAIRDYKAWALTLLRYPYKEIDLRCTVCVCKCSCRGFFVSYHACLSRKGQMGRPVWGLFFHEKCKVLLLWNIFTDKLTEPLRKAHHIRLFDYRNLLTIKDLNTCLQEGHVQGARRACSACLKGLVLDRVKAPVDRTGKHSLHDREGGQGKRKTE